MDVKEIMTPNPEYLLATSTLSEAAKKCENWIRVFTYW